ncbi:winged helix-turn-helix domain-containing tetratricopeptide repeat protein [Qipengyuania zhejiangensis]|uniref:winged helix-turn-helix domain-containing tetratricopeptide repeat protein n=1 Tax=Qipengyuania zhejiangensis TaxID=3077782 RepID=UPI002D79C8A1|nr:winged helix-turn-helix domain-containing protein [Qipengyuania sp. Z2]
MPDSGARTYCFEEFELDSARFELRRNGSRLHVEPQVLSLLILLAANRERMVGKDEIIERIWDGRAVSESAVAARIKAARKSVGDDGKGQRLIRTIHGKGFRFVGDVVERGAVQTVTITTPQPELVAADAIDSALRTSRNGRPSIAVLPFTLVGEPGPHDILVDALPADIIMDLSRMHWLFVIARGSSFRFREPDTDPLAVGRELAVRYCLTGSIEISGQTVTVGVTLVDTRDGEAIWADQYRGDLSELQQMRPDIEAHVVAALELQIPRNEVRLARMRPASGLDAWACFHLGLDHMYRFTRDDNARAAQLFEQSLERDPYFSRALGGLSFTHFQNAFLLYADDPKAEMEVARTFAHRAVEADRLDPFAHFNVGRSFWIDGNLQDSLVWFDQATSLSPNFAQGVYNRGLVGVMVGRTDQADADLSLALDLSPLDPLAYAMVSSRALAALQNGDLGQAAELGARAARMPGAHKHIELIAAFTAHLVGDQAGAQRWLAKARSADPALSADTFFRAFPFANTVAREVMERSMKDLGL